MPLRGAGWFRRSVFRATVCALLSPAFHLLLFTFYYGFGGSAAFANPTGGQVVAGQAGISANGSTLTVNQLSDRAIIHWQDFSISAGNTTRFVQPSAASAALNRVTGGNPSAIHGTLQSNGQIYLINPNGVLVGPGGVVNTGGFLASTLDVSNDDFLRGGDLRFSGSSTASVVNLGKISGSTADVILIAHTVENHGTIDAPNGTAALAAGSEVLVKASGQERVFVEAGSSSGTSSATQAGLIRAAAAEIKAAGGNEYALAIKHTGVTRATGVTKSGGRVYLSAGKGKVRHTGTISARKSNGSGGTVRVEATHVELAAGSKIDVSADAASGVGNGGEVLIGGGYQGKDSSMRNAQSVTAEEGSLIIADAATTGKGGTVILWSDQQTSFAGEVLARGGSGNGDGGFVEVSGKENLRFTGWVDTGGGTLLLDPANITVQTADGDMASTGESTWGVGQINTLLAANNVTLHADNNITWNGGVSLNYANAASRTLTLQAGNNIVFNSGARIESTGGALSVILNSNRDSIGAGNIQLVGTTIITNGGDIVMGGGTDPWTGFARGGGVGTAAQKTGIYLASNSLLDSGAGAISLRGQALTGGDGSDNTGIRLAGNTEIRSSTGSIALHGVGGGTTNNNYGVQIGGHATLGSRVRSTGSADIRIHGSGGAGASSSGVYLREVGKVISEGSGDIFLSGHGTSTESNSQGIYIYDTGGVESNTGNITLEGSALSTDPEIRLIKAAADPVTDAIRSTSGNITLIGNTMSVIDRPIRSAGHLYIQPRTPATTIGVAGGGGTLQVNANFLNSIQSGFKTVFVGTPEGAGNININARTFNNPFSFRTGSGAININGVLGNEGRSLSFIGKSVTFGSGGGINTSNPTGAGGAVTISTQDAFNAMAFAAGRIINTSGASHGAVLINSATSIQLDNARLSINGGSVALTQIGAANQTLAGYTSTGVPQLILVTPETVGGKDIHITSALNFNGDLFLQALRDIKVSADVSATGSVVLAGDGNNNGTGGVGVAAAGSVTAGGNLTLIGKSYTDLTGTLSTNGILIEADGANNQLSAAGDILLQSIAANTDINVAGRVVRTGTGAGSITMQSHRSVFVSSFVGAGAGAGATDVVLNANRDEVGSGNIELIGATITSNGGAITLGGGLNPLTTAAIGVSAATEGRKSGVFLSGSTLNSGAGVISLRGHGVANVRGFGVDVAYNSSIVSTTGAINVHGVGGGGASGSATNSNVGIFLRSNGTTITSQSGNIHLVGEGGTGTTSGTTNYGILVDNNATVTSTGTGTITLDGTGGGNDSTTNYGTSLRDGGKVIGAGSGAILVNGQGGYGSHGIYMVSGGQILSQGTSTITLDGTGGATGTAGSTGVYLSGGTTKVESATGNIQVKGQGGAAAVTNNYGIALDGGSVIASTGAATVTLTGTGGVNGTTGNHGVLLTGTNTAVRSQLGAISITGNEDGIAGNNHGVHIVGGARVESTGTVAGAATVTLKGTGGSAASNHGVNIDGSTTVIRSGYGDIRIEGYGGASSAAAAKRGVYISNAASIVSDGDGSNAAKITIEGTGGTGGSQEQGVYLNNARVRSKDGDIWISGAGRTSGSSFDLMIYNGSQVIATGSGDIRLTGMPTGSAGAIAFFAGGAAGSSSITSHSGDIVIEGNTWYANSAGILSSTGGASAGSLIIKPYTEATNIGIGGGSGTLSLTAAHLDMIQDGFKEIVIGHENGTGTVNVGTYTAFKDNLTIRTPRGNGSINVNGALATGSGVLAGTITLEAGLNILANVGSSIRTDGEKITLNSDRDRGLAGDTVGGRIALTSATIESNGGDIVLGGGNDPLNEAADNSGAAGGSRGIHLTGSAKIDSGAGSISMRGKGADVTGHRGIEMHDTSSVTSTSGNIFMHGQGGTLAGGSQMMGTSIRGSVTSTSGNIDITGIGGTNSSGMLFWNAAKVETGAGRTITLTGIAQGAAADFYVWNDGAGQKATFGNAGGATADVVVNANTLSFESVATEFKSGGTLTFQPRTAGQAVNIAGTPAGLALTTDRLAAIADGFSEVVIGNAIAGNLTVGGAATFTDNLRLIGNGTLAVNGALNVGTNRLVLLPAGNTTQSAAITAGSLRLGGNGNFTLENAGNNIGTLAKSGAGSVSLYNATALTVGSVDGVNGVTGSTVDLRALSDNLILNQGVTGTASGNAVVLSTLLNFINNAGASGVQTPSGRWLVYSNGPAGNTFGALNSGQGALYGRTATSHAPGSISETGNRYLFATTPSLTVEATLSDTKTYGDTYTFPTPVEGTHYTVTGFVDAAAYGNVFTQDTAANIGLSGAPVLASDGAAADAAVSGSPYVVTIAQGTLTNTAGYGFGTFASGGGITVTQRAITLTANTATKIYGNADPALSVSITGGSLGGSDTLADVTGTVGRQTGENVGLYDILLGTGAKASNYTITFDADNDAFSITPRALIITANDQSKTYGDTVTFVGTEFTVSGLAYSDTVASANLSSVGAPATAGVGGYAIDIDGATGTGLSNYTITYVGGTLTVDRRALTITANHQSKTYGDAFAFAGTEFIVSGLVNGDTVTSANLSSRGAARSAGVAGAPYAIRIGGASGSGLSNYAITYQPGSMAVRPAKLLITANDAMRTQSQPNPAFTASYAGFVRGEGPGDLSGTLGFAIKADGSAAAGAYAIMPYGLRSENYRIQYAAGQLTVLPGGGAGDLLERSDMADPFGFLKGYWPEEPEIDEEGRGGRVEYISRDYPGSLLHLNSGEVE